MLASRYCRYEGPYRTGAHRGGHERGGAMGDGVRWQDGKMAGNVDREMLASLVGFEAIST